MTSFWQLFKRRVVPIAFICAMAVLIQKTCNKQTRTHSTIVLDLGDQAAQVVRVDAELVVEGDDGEHTQFHRAALDGLAIGPCELKVAMPSDDGKLSIDVQTKTAIKHVERKVHATEGATITIPLADDLK